MHHSLPFMLFVFLTALALCLLYMALMLLMLIYQMFIRRYSWRKSVGRYLVAGLTFLIVSGLLLALALYDGQLDESSNAVFLFPVVGALSSAIGVVHLFKPYQK